MRLILGPIAISVLLGGCIYSGDDGAPSHSYSYDYTSDCGTGGSSASSGGTSAYAGTSSSGTGGSTASAGSGAAAGDSSTPPPPPPPPPTCSELANETACELRTDCQPIYAGTDCSCGPNCTCFDGAEGCTCEHFAYFTCVALDATPP